MLIDRLPTDQKLSVKTVVEPSFTGEEERKIVYLPVEMRDQNGIFHVDALTDQVISYTTAEGVPFFEQTSQNKIEDAIEFATRAGKKLILLNLTILENPQQIWWGKWNQFYANWDIGQFRVDQGPVSYCRDRYHQIVEERHDPAKIAEADGFCDPWKEKPNQELRERQVADEIDLLVNG